MLYFFFLAFTINTILLCEQVLNAANKLVLWQCQSPDELEHTKTALLQDRMWQHSVHRHFLVQLAQFNFTDVHVLMYFFFLSFIYC